MTRLNHKPHHKIEVCVCSRSILQKDKNEKRQKQTNKQTQSLGSEKHVLGLSTGIWADTLQPI